MNTSIVNAFLGAFATIPYEKKYPNINATDAHFAYKFVPRTETLLFVNFANYGKQGFVITDQKIYYNQYETKWWNVFLIDITHIERQGNNICIYFGRDHEVFRPSLFGLSSLWDFSLALEKVVHSAHNPTSSSYHYYVALDGQQAGPYSVTELSDLASKGRINNNTLVWAEGFNAWTPVGQVLSLPVVSPPVPNMPPPIPQQNTYQVQPVQQQQEEEHLYIKCINCGEVYTVDKDDYSENDILYTCDKCGGDIGVRFFGYCNRCDVHVGFVDDPREEDSSLLGTIVKGAIKGAINPEYGFKSLGALVDDIPRANTYGICPNCGELYIECPNCREAVHVPHGSDLGTDSFTCPNCGTKSRHP